MDHKIFAPRVLPGTLGREILAGWEPDAVSHHCEVGESSWGWGLTHSAPWGCGPGARATAQGRAGGCQGRLQDGSRKSGQLLKHGGFSQAVTETDKPEVEETRCCWPKRRSQARLEQGQGCRAQGALASTHSHGHPHPRMLEPL